MIVTSAIAGKFDAIAVIALVDYRNSGGPFGLAFFNFPVIKQSPLDNFSEAYLIITALNDKTRRRSYSPGCKFPRSSASPPAQISCPIFIIKETHDGIII